MQVASCATTTPASRLALSTGSWLTAVRATAHPGSRYGDRPPVLLDPSQRPGRHLDRPFRPDAVSPHAVGVALGIVDILVPKLTLAGRRRCGRARGNDDLIVLTGCQRPALIVPLCRERRRAAIPWPVSVFGEIACAPVTTARRPTPGGAGAGGARR